MSDFSPTVKFDTHVPDATYTGKWFRYDVKIMVKDVEITGKCDAGTTGDQFEFCIVEVTNGQGNLRMAR